jgi:hypothetical protein
MKYIVMHTLLLLLVGRIIVQCTVYSTTVTLSLLYSYHERPELAEEVQSTIHMYSTVAKAKSKMYYSTYYSNPCYNLRYTNG